MNIIGYKDFFEAKLSDISKVSGFGNIIKQIKDYQEMDFDMERALLRFTTLNKRMGKNKIRMELTWNHNASHSIIKRIKQRTSFKSVEEFNNNLKEILNKIFPDKIGTDIFKNGKYSIYDKEHDNSIIFTIDINKFINGEYKIMIITVLPGIRDDENTIKIIEI